ncbi:MAG: hypothetical protein ACXWI7_05740, partial [Croceibacterium sp.]
METLKALAPLGIPAAIIFVCIVLVVIVGAVVFGDLQLEAGSGKLFHLKLSKRPTAIEALSDRPHVEPASEPAVLTADRLPALAHDPVPQEPDENDDQEAGGENPDTFWQYI